MRFALLLALCAALAGCGEAPRSHADEKAPAGADAPRTTGPSSKIPMH